MNPMPVRSVHSDDAFFAMRQEWNALLQQSHSNTVFLTWEWMWAWWKAYGFGKELVLLRVEKHGQLIGLIPLYHDRTTLLSRRVFRQLAFIGDGSWDSDYLDVISLPGEETTVMLSILDYLDRGNVSWDQLVLNEVPATSPHLNELEKQIVTKGWYWEAVERPCASTRLPPDWDTYLGTLAPRMRTKIRSLWRRLQEGRVVRFDKCCHPEDIEPRLYSLFDLHTRRWRQEHARGVFDSVAKRKFYEEISKSFLAQGWLQFYSLAVDEQFVAHQFCFEYENKMFLLQEGYDPAWNEQGVGNVLRACVLRDCIDRKVDEYDFLGGVTAHKMSWGAKEKKSLRVIVGRSGVKNFIRGKYLRTLEATKPVVKRNAPVCVSNWIRKVRNSRCTDP